MRGSFLSVTSVVADFHHYLALESAEAVQIECGRLTHWVGV